MLFVRKNVMVLRIIGFVGAVSHIPYEIHGTPSESGAKCGEDEFVALLEFVFVLVEADWNGGC